MLSVSLEENLTRFETDFDGSADYIERRFRLAGSGAALLTLEGMVNKQVLTQSVMNPLMDASLLEEDPVKRFDYLRDCVLSTVDQKEVTDYSEAVNFLMNGFAVFLLDGCLRALAIGVQGFQFRGVGDPQGEVMQRGSREGFVEPLQINLSMIRRRLKTPQLKFEKLILGKESNTNVCLCYLRGVVSPELLSRVRNSVKEVDLATVLAAGYVTPFLRKSGNISLFTTVGLSERPDTVCGKIQEGRIALVIDGTPNVLIIPHLFIESFQSFDDYAHRPFYTSFIRLLKLLAFFLSMLLPGFYVATTTFHPELIPEPLLLKIMQSQSSNPFPIMLEAIVIHIIYEIMREAGLRAPKALSHAVSIVGALVIGDTAVSSGLISAPTLMIIALTAISSYLVPSFYESTALCRLIFIIVGGTMGFWGLMVGIFLMTANICSESIYGVPFSAPVSPFRGRAMRDVFVRASWKKFSGREERVQNMPGSTVDQADRL